MRAPVVYGSPLEILRSLGWLLLILAIFTAAWWPIIRAGVWLFRRLHH
ncbi:MAG TPA: hypothetical protein VFX20_18240 [Steroidobacteraceae bacterium]|nr:hypothetical protein [Steroidobacteraceae bacterium]